MFIRLNAKSLIQTKMTYNNSHNNELIKKISEKGNGSQYIISSLRTPFRFKL